MKKLYSLEIEGDQYNWAFTLEADPKHVKQWQEDGLNVTEIINTIPETVQKNNLTKIWVFFQDVFNFRNPFKKE